MPNPDTVLLEYQNKLEALRGGLAQAQTKQSGAIAMLAVVVVIFLFLCNAAYSSRRAAPGWFPPLVLAMAVMPCRNFLASRRKVSEALRLRRFYQSGMDRLTGDWSGKGVSGDEFSRTGHLYERDLNVFGAGSMFELLCTTRSQLGQGRLASYLLDLPDRNETMARQEAVKELQPRSGLREQICLLGKYSFQGCDWEPFREWLDSPQVLVYRVLSWILPATSIALVLAASIRLTPPEAGLWTRAAPFLIPLVAAQVLLALSLRDRVRPVLERSRSIGHEIKLFRQGLELLEAQSFHSAKLKDLTERVKGAGGAVRKLNRLIKAVDECNQDWFYLPSRVLLVDTQLGLAIERWKARHGEDLRTWLDAWAEFEALNALGCYAHEHPEDVFPEMLDSPAGTAEFEAAGFGHPLLAESACIRNDVHFNPERKFYLVSGSNMAGKSTFLRAIGINAVLGSAGAPVRAHRARQSSFAVCASVSIIDSLSEGKSKFMAEVDRLREILRAAASGPKPVLFVIDEILSGTNSRDRRAAVESFLRALIHTNETGAGAIGALSTHDLALAEIAEDPDLGGSNVHMESRDPSDPFAFDYLLKPGVSTHSNALAIARMAGVAV
jgi:hypothetical protein